MSVKPKSDLHSTHRRNVLIFSLLAVVLVSSVALIYIGTTKPKSDSFGDAIHVASEKNLRLVINNAENGKSVVIVFNDDISLTDSSLTIPANKNITLTSKNKVLQTNWCRLV